MNLLLSLLPLLLSFPQAATQADELGWMNGDEFVQLTVDGSSLGVRFQPGIQQSEAVALLQTIPGLELGPKHRPWLESHMMRFDIQPALSANDALSLANTLQQDARVLAASPLFIDPVQDPLYLTGEILLRWKESTPISEREQLTQGLNANGVLEYTTNPGASFRVPQTMAVFKVANRIARSGAVEFCHPNFSLTRIPYYTPNDPKVGEQWHLESRGQNGAKVDADVDAEGAWDITLGDPNSCVAVVDTGMELTHEDLADDLVQGRDVLSNDNNPRAEDGFLGLFPEDHATSVAGVTAAIGDNNKGVSGISPRSKIMPIRFLSGSLFGPFPTTQDEADAFNYANQNGAWVINNSWGPAFGATLAPSTKVAIDDCNRNGRNGLGMVVFFAAGNSGNNNSNNGYAAYSGCVGVSACNDFGILSGYSCFGPTIDCAAPSNDSRGNHNGITTTDRKGSKGYDNGLYTDGFGGTSSASPLAAGVMLLTMSANPTLNRAEALECFLGSCEKIDPAHGDYDASGHSDWYGHGRVNAEQAVLAAVNYGSPIDVVHLTGTTSAQVGQTATYQISGMSPGAPFTLLASLLSSGSYFGGARMDLGGPFFFVDSSTADASGQAVSTVIISGKAAGRTIYLEALAENNAGPRDSNVLTLIVP